MRLKNESEKKKVQQNKEKEKKNKTENTEFICGIRLNFVNLHFIGRLLFCRLKHIKIILLRELLLSMFIP